MSAGAQSEAPAAEVLPIPVYGPPIVAPPLDDPLAPARREALVEITVSPEGKVIETRLLQSSDKAFGEAALDSAIRWLFKPGYRNGEPDTFQLTITFDSALSDLTASRLGSLYRTLADPVYNSDQVDREPVLAPRNVKRPWPAYPPQFRGSGRRAQVSFRLVVDAQGMPVNPSVAHYTDPDFIDPAISEVARLRFTPAMKDGEPVHAYISVTVPFAEARRGDSDSGGIFPGRGSDRSRSQAERAITR